MRLGSAAAVRRLHDALCLARTYPDDPATLAAVERSLGEFARRVDLRRHRARLENSGIAGCDVRFRFFAATALRLARRFPAGLTYDWEAWDDPSRLEALLPLLAAHAETPGLDELDLPLRAWLSRMRPPGVGDAAFVTRRLAARLGDPFVFEHLHDELDAPMRLAASPGGPSRTAAHWPGAPVAFQTAPLRHGRPRLVTEVARPPRSVRSLAPREGRRMIDLALDAMVVRDRDLDVFAYGDARDVRLVDCGDGLCFAAIGARPERRLLLEAVYGFVTLRNGVPIGYVLASALFRSAEIAYNVFDTWRGAEAAWVYGRVLAMTRHLLGADRFTIYPYQLGGDGNEEGLRSGAWWFYRKLGFVPHDGPARRLMRAEEARMRRDPAHRSNRATLERLANANLYWPADRERRDRLGVLPLAHVGLAVTGLIAARGDAADRGADCAGPARALLGAGPGRDWTPGERLAFTRWAPLVLALPGVSRWTAQERHALARVIRAKGGRRESEFVRRFDAHPRLGPALARLARSVRV